MFSVFLLNFRPQLIALGLFTLACGISVREYLSFNTLDVLDIEEAKHNNKSHDSSHHRKTESESIIEKADHPEKQDISSKIPSDSDQIITVCSGDTLSSILGNQGICARDIDLISKKLSKAHNLRSLQIGQIIKLNITHRDHNEAVLKQMILNDRNGNTITVSAADKGYTVTVKNRVLRTVLKRASGTIETSFSNAAMVEGVPQSIIHEAANAISPLVSVMKLRQGSAFEILYDEKIDAITGQVVGTRTLRYIAVYSNGKLHQIYRFGNHGYYTENGKSVRNEFLIMPLKNRNTRVSSKFGYRTHPILGIVKKHTGIDYAAQYGAEVYAAANGVVVKAGRFGGYGLYVRIRHANGFETTYAHLSSISVFKGDYVCQGKTIGRVGRSGRVTGPHLHHEVIRNHDYVDPSKYYNIGATQLNSKELIQFKQQQKELSVQLAGIPQDRQIA